MAPGAYEQMEQQFVTVTFVSVVPLAIKNVPDMENAKMQLVTVDLKGGGEQHAKSKDALDGAKIAQGMEHVSHLLDAAYVALVGAEEAVRSRNVLAGATVVIMVFAMGSSMTLQSA